MRAALVASLVVVAALAGCAGRKGDDGGGASSTPSASGTATGAPAARSASLAADRLNGTAPLTVGFTLDATGGTSSWRLSFGDGSSTNGTVLPAVANHTYVVGGDFSATLTVGYAGGANASAALAITVALPQGGAGAPDVTHFGFGESLGCTGDAHAINPSVPLNCLSFQGGPDASGIDGHWLALDERYWGMALTTTMEEPSGSNQDSDCYFLAEDAATETGSGSNGGGLCLGVVPDGTSWLFLYPWGLPAAAMTADFA